jgi:hypothetical protein
MTGTATPSPRHADMANGLGGRVIVTIEPGWDIYSLDGELLGEVTTANRRQVRLSLEEYGHQRSLEIATHEIIELEEREMRARVARTTADVLADEAGTP